MRWIPPLDVTAAEIAEAVEIFGETLASMPRT
jgi:acetylornithine/succinyldiaminopimelate/putrescine aminotransferase